MEWTVTELKEEIDSSTIVAGDVNTLFSIMDDMTRQKINKEMMTWTTL